MIPIPYTALATEVALPSTPANFPACRMFLKCNEASGATSFTDSISGQVFPGSGVITGSGAGYLNLNGNFSANLTTPITIGSKLAMLITIQELGTSPECYVSLNNTGSTYQITVDTAATFSWLRSNSVNSAGLTVANGPGTCCGIVGQPTVANSVKLFSATTSVNATETVTAAGLATMSTPLSKLTIDTTAAGAGTAKLYGMALFVFDTKTAIPEAASIVAWTLAQWKTNNIKTLYPGLVGLN